MPSKPVQKNVCGGFCFNKTKVAGIKKALPPAARLSDMAELFAVIAEPTRIKILLALKESELCVCDISHILNLSLSAVSHQLRLLRSLRLVKYRNSGKLVFYSLSDSCVIKLIAEGFKHTGETGERG